MSKFVLVHVCVCLFASYDTPKILAAIFDISMRNIGQQLCSFKVSISFKFGWRRSRLKSPEKTLKINSISWLFETTFYMT